MHSLLSVCLLSCLSLFSVSIAEGHSREITQCKGNIVYKKAIPVKPPYIVESSGLVAEEYDTDGDGRTDVVALSHQDGASHKEHPVFWMVDFDKDGDADAVYVDKRGLGKCTDIVLYQDLTKPLGVPANPNRYLDHSKGGKL